MSRCQHCHKLTHSEHLEVYYDKSDADKVYELTQMENWKPAYEYNTENPLEYGKLKVGDIHIHFLVKL